MNVSELLGKRILWKSDGYNRAIDEAILIEISPSGKWVRLKTANGQKRWHLLTDIKLVEELLTLTNDRPKEDRHLPDRDWLRAVGFSNMVGSKFAVETLPGIYLTFDDHNGFQLDGAVWLRNTVNSEGTLLPTRGDVIKLLRALDP